MSITTDESAISQRVRGLLALIALAAALAAAFALVVLLAPPVSASASPHTPSSAGHDAPAAGSLDVQPFPGTPDASPQTDIGFPALAPREIASLVVIGSRSGPHRGRLSALPAGHGTRFLPLHPFTAGERVSVRAILRSPAAGAGAGAPPSTRISFAFTVAVPVRSGAGAAARAARTAAVSTTTHTFYSEGWLHPPVVSVSGIDPDPAMGDIFADAENSVQAGPLILSPQGQLIYFEPLSGGMRAFNVEVQQYQGQSVLTYWQGVGVRTGHGVILNHSYQQIAAVYAGNGYSADAHEFQLTPQGDALITAYAPVRANLSSIGGPRHGILMDSIIQEIDIATGAVLWEWHARGHVGLRQTHAGTPGPWPYDFFHINSIQLLPDGNLLISARYTWALYEISMRTGRIVRVIGGERSSFRMGPGTNFEWQHDAAMQPDGTITVFDNASNGSTANESRSRGLRIRLHSKTRRATLVSAYTSQPPLLSTSQGSVQPLPDGNTFIGWGSSGYFTEHGPGGRQLFSLHFHFPLESYRGYRFQWWGQPTTPPSIAAAATSTGTTVYASWDGATTVASWQVLAGPSPASLTPVGEFPDTSFETAMATTTTEPYVAVQALDGAGNVLGTSATIER